jgi:hypothetical protein
MGATLKRSYQMTFTFNMTVTAKTETMLQDEMQQELLNLIGKPHCRLAH